jgi:RPA family protein
LETQNNYLRATAKFIDLKTLKSGSFIQKEGFDPSFVDTIYGDISRLNIFGVIVSKSILDETFEIEDGSDRILIRKGSMNLNNFDFDLYNLGDIVNIIGKVRSFNNQFFLIPEIIRKVKNKKWIEVRKLELSLLKPLKSNEEIDNSKNEIKTKNEIIEENIYDEDEIEENSSSNPIIDKILNTIRNLDSGEGADKEDIIKISEIENAESILVKLLEQGEIFELRPNKLKVLE